MSSLITAVAVFFLVSLAVVFCIALLNIFTKSFKPQQSVIMISALLAVFIFGSLMFLVTTTTLTQEIDRGFSFNNSSGF